MLCNGHLWDDLKLIDMLADYLAGGAKQICPYGESHTKAVWSVTMRELYVEQRDINGKNLLSWDLAHHLYVRSVRDKVVIATDKPVELLSATRKQWFKLMRHVMRQQASTLNAPRLVELAEQISYMQNLRFSTKLPGDCLDADITFATIEDLIGAAPICRMAYVAYDVSREEQCMLTSWMPPGGVVVIYVQPQTTAVKTTRKDLIHGANARTANQESYQATLR